MTKEDIRAMLLKGERVTLECKKAKAEVPKSVWQTYSAFANTILLSVDEDLQENSIHVWNRVDDKTFFRNLGGYTEDRQTVRYGNI